MKNSVAAAPKSVPLTKEQSLVLGIINARIRGKKCYGDADAYQQQLAALCPVGKEVTLPDGRRFAIIDAFAGKRLVAKMTYVDRYELREIEV